MYVNILYIFIFSFSFTHENVALLPVHSTYICYSFVGPVQTHLGRFKIELGQLNKSWPVNILLISDTTNIFNYNMFESVYI